MCYLVAMAFFKNVPSPSGVAFTPGRMSLFDQVYKQIVIGVVLGMQCAIAAGQYPYVDILPALKREDSHGTVPLGWDIVVYDVACS